MKKSFFNKFLIIRNLCYSNMEEGIQNLSDRSKSRYLIFYASQVKKKFSLKIFETFYIEISQQFGNLNFIIYENHILDILYTTI